MDNGKQKEPAPGELEATGDGSGEPLPVADDSEKEASAVEEKYPENPDIPTLLAAQRRLDSRLSEEKAEKELAALVAKYPILKGRIKDKSQGKPKG